MRKTLEDFYYGNIVPCERQMAHASELKRATDRIAHYESQLTEQLDEAERTILTKLIRSQHEIDSITALENFILGFRLGVRMMAECMDENDGDTQEGDQSWLSAAPMAKETSENEKTVAGRAVIPQVMTLKPASES